MSTVRTIVRLARSDARWRALVVEAARNLLRAKIALRLLPFRRAVRSGSVALGPVRSADVAAIVRAVEAVASRLPWRTVCFDKGLAVQRSLRRRGFDARLHYGLSAPSSGQFDAHVWVELDGAVVIGGEEAVGQHSVAVFPRDGSA